MIPFVNRQADQPTGCLKPCRDTRGEVMLALRKEKPTNNL